MICYPTTSQSPRPSGFAEIVSDDFPVLHGAVVSILRVYQRRCPRRACKVAVRQVLSELWLTFKRYRLQPVVMLCVIPYTALRLCSDNEFARLRNFNRELSVGVGFGSLNRELEISEVESSRAIRVIKEVVLNLIF